MSRDKTQNIVKEKLILIRYLLVCSKSVNTYKNGKYKLCVYSINMYKTQFIKYLLNLHI